MVVTPKTRRPTRPVANRAVDTQAIATFLDGVKTTAILESNVPWLAPDLVSIRDCEVDQVRFNSRAKDRERRRPFLCVSYRLHVTAAAGQAHEDRFLYIEVYPDRLPGLDGTSGLAPGPSHAVLHLPALDAVVWEFPNDPHLPHLVEVMDPDAVRQHLPYAQLPAGLDGPADVADVRVDVLRYKPETHCAARYEVGWGPASDRRVVTLFGKTYGGERVEEIHGQMEAVWHKSFDDPQSFVTSQPLGYARAVRTVWQATIGGLPLLPLVVRGDCDDVLAQIGTALAILHDTEPVGTLRVGIADQLDEMDAQLAALIEAFPAARTVLRPLGEQLRDEAATLPAVAETLVHGDFIAKNLLMRKGRIVIFDFDDFVVGDPVQDVARFLVDLHFLEDRDSHLVTLRPRDPAVVNAMANVFTEAYRSRARANVTDASLSWHWRVQAIAKIHYYFKRQHLRPGFAQDLDAMLALLG